MYKPGKEKATRVELRNPDPACNPYLAFSVMLAAGLEGMKKKYKLPAQVTNNIYRMTEDEREKAGIEADKGSTVRYCTQCALKKGYAHYKEMKGEMVLTFFPESDVSQE